jgi:quinol-cytochrome oxidoreductase complex cytochrome b subunit
MKQEYRVFFNSLLLHFRPRTLPGRTLRFNLTWGLGGSAAVLVLLLLSTGILLKFVYQPSATTAYESIVSLQNDVLFGRLIRNVHHWSANLLILVAFLHLLRVFFTGGYHPPRRFNWILGLSLFSLVILSNITGYLLPWDQLAYWAITILTGMLDYIPGIGRWLQTMLRGGTEVGPNTLSNFYALHTAVLPILLISVMPFHFWRIRKAGGLVVPRSPEEPADANYERVPAIPNLLLREIVTGLVVIAGVFLFSALVNAPLLDKANPGLSPNPTRAPWYFAGVQEILMHFHPLFSFFILPLMTLAALFGLPYFRRGGASAGVWFVSSEGRRMAVVAVITALIGTVAAILISEYLLHSETWLSLLPSILGTGVVPFVVLLTAIAVFMRFIRKCYSAGTGESVQTLFVLIVAAFIIMTITSIVFRGEGMRLIWPWLGT